MDECPHCGEPIEEEAPSCPHCGSDLETGWKPDADYYGLELPEEGEEEEASPQYFPGPLALRWERALGVTFVAVPGFLFLWLDALAHGPNAALFALLLALGLLAFALRLSVDPVPAEKAS